MYYILLTYIISITLHHIPKHLYNGYYKSHNYRFAVYTASLDITLTIVTGIHPHNV